MKKFFFLFVTISFSSLLQAQVKLNEELKNLMKQSFVFFPKIKEVENAEITAQEKLNLIELNKNPQFDVSASYNFVMPKISFPINGREIQFAPTNNVATSFGGVYPIYDFGRLKTNIDKAKIDLSLSKHTTNSSKIQLAYQVANIYYSIIYLQKALAIQDSILLYFNENKKIIDKKIMSGEALKIDALNLQANIDAEENKRIDLKSFIQKQLNLLNYTTGINKISGEEFDSIIELLNIDEALDSFQKNNPEFQLANDKVLLSKKEIDIIQLNKKPNLNIHGAAGIKNGYVPSVNEVRFNYLAGISFSLPIDAFGKTKQQVKLQQSIVTQNQLFQASILSNNKKDIEQTLLDIDVNNKKIKNTESQIKSAKSALDLTSSRYHNGVATYLDIISAAANVEKARLTKLQSEYQLCISTLELARLMGNECWN